MKIKANKMFLPLFAALANMLLATIKDFLGFLPYIKAEYSNALEKLRLNPRQKILLPLILTITLGDNGRFKYELNKIEKRFAEVN